jgi:hypothetical protein
MQNEKGKQWSNRPKGAKLPGFQYLKVKNSVQRQVKSLNVYLT